MKNGVFSTIFLYVKNIGFYVGTFFACLIFLPVPLLISLLPTSSRHDNTLYFYLTYLLARISLAFSGLSLRTYGIEHIPFFTSEPSIIAINHSSALDIPCVETLFKGQPHIWISNDYRHVPVFGTLLQRMHIVVADGTTHKPIQAIRQAIRLTEGKKRHLFLFPEGTRHADGAIHTFLPGLTLLAEKLNRPITPVVIYGLHKVLPKKSWLIRSSSTPILVSIGKAFTLTAGQTREEFLANIQNWFTLEMNRLKKIAERDFS